MYLAARPQNHCSASPLTCVAEACRDPKICTAVLCRWPPARPGDVGLAARTAEPKPPETRLVAVRQPGGETAGVGPRASVRRNGNFRTTQAVRVCPEPVRRDPPPHSFRPTAQPRPGVAHHPPSPSPVLAWRAQTPGRTALRSCTARRRLTGAWRRCTRRRRFRRRRPRRSPSCACAAWTAPTLLDAPGTAPPKRAWLC